MASVVTIPRFLLPRGAALFRPTQTPARANLIYQCLTSSSSRHASTSKAKPSSTVLAKPDRFNPPSHPSKLVKSAPIRQYGPAVTEDQKQVHRSKQYPHSAPPKGSFMDRFIHNRVLHTMIALGVLLFFAVWTFILGFKATSPYAGQMPGWGKWFRHPIDAMFQFVSVMKLHIIHDSEVARAKRERMITETFKTKAYRVMHGLEPLKGQPTEVHILVARMKGEYTDGPNGPELVFETQEKPKRRPIKKWLGIW